MRLRGIWLALILLPLACNKPGGGNDAPAPEAEGDTEHAQDEFEFEDDDEAAEAEASAPEEVREAAKSVEVSVAAARAQVDAERLALEATKTELEGARKEFDQQLAKIDDLEKRLDDRLGIGEIADKRRRQRIAGLAKIVITMPPQAAANMMAQMPLEDAQDLIQAMAQENQRKASKLLSAMPGDRAAAVGQRFLDHDPKALVDPKATPAAPPPPATTPSAKEDES